MELLNHWNKAYNLTAIKDPKAQVYKHIIDSLSTHDVIHGDNVLDVGTGPGLPGIPLAIYFPKKTFTLVDSSQKRITFLRQVIRQLSISNVRPFSPKNRTSKHRNPAI